MTAAAPEPRMPSPPRTPLPAGACDTHTHVFGPSERFPLRLSTPYDPPDAPYERHREMLRRVGLDRAVLVQPAPYGTDCAAILDAVARSAGALKGISTAGPDTPADELARLKQGGIVGLRFVEITLPGGSGRFAGAEGFGTLARLAPLMSEIGLHAQLWVDCDRLVADADMLTGLGIPVVVEHMARFKAENGVDDRDFQAVLRLLAEGRIWLKLSLCRTSTQPPDYPDARPFHDALMAANPDRLLWVSDWPHVRMGAAAPDVGHLIDLFDAWTGGDALLRRKIFVDNPKALYGFEDQEAGASNGERQCR